MSEVNKKVAGVMIMLADMLKCMIDHTPEDEDITFLVHVRDTMLDWSMIFAPPGEPEDGYPTEGAKVFNIESERAKRRRG